MRKLLLIIAVLLSFGVSAQTFTPVHNYQAPDGIDVAKFFGIPWGNTPTLNGVTRAGAHPLFYNTTDSSLYQYTGTQWIIVGGGNRAGKDTVKVGYGLEVTWDSTGHQVLYADHPDGLVSGGIVSYSQVGLTFNVSPSIFSYSNRLFIFPETSLTLDAANLQPRKDVFYIDTLGPAVKKGDSGVVAITPQLEPGQFALTDGFLINPGDTIPSNINTTIIYDQNIEWTSGQEGGTPRVMDFNSTANPYHLTKALYVSKYNNSQAYFYAPSRIQASSVNTIDMWIYLTGAMSASNNIYLLLFDSATRSANYILLNSDFGFNKNDSNHYQHVVIPASAIRWLSPTFNLFELTFTGSDTSGAKGLYVDLIRLQSGIPNIPPANDYSNKLDSVTTVKLTDSTYIVLNWIKGLSYQKGDTIHTGSSSGGSVNSVTGNPSGLVDNTDPINPIVQQDASKVNVSDTASMLSHYTLRNELQDTAAAIRSDFPTGGSPNTSVGSGFKVAINGTNNIKSLTAGYAFLLDSINANQINLKVDSAALSLKYLRIADSAILSNQIQRNVTAINARVKYSDTAAMLSPYLPKGGIIAGTNVSLPGSGTTASPFVINAADSNAYISSTIVNYGTDSVYWIFQRRIGISDTFVLAKNGVDSVWRTAGKDSIQFLIRGRYHAIKDSTAGVGATAWLAAGNSGLTAGTNFLGTIDYVPLELRVKNRRAGWVDSVNTTAGKTTFGYLAGNADTSKNITAFGYKAAVASISGVNNSAFGNNSLLLNTSGANNTAMGNLALSANTTGADLTAFGSSAGKNVTNGGGTYIGAYSGELSAGGANSVGLGKYTLRQNTGGSNVAIGFSVMQQSASGIDNTGVGHNVMSIGAVSGNDNTGIGFSSLINLSSGSNNLGIGAYSLKYATTQSKLIVINTIDRTNYQREQNQSPVYIQQVAANLPTQNQYITLNGKIGNNNLTPTAWLHLTRGTSAAATAPIKFDPPISLVTTAAGGNGTTDTLKFASTTNPPFVLGSIITVSGVTPSGYNGTFSVLGITDTTVFYTNTGTGPQTVAGTITQGGILTTPEVGALENDSTSLYYTGGSGINLQRNKLIKGISGTATLSSGTVTVSTTYIKTGSRILLTVATPSGTQGFLSAPTVSITSGTSFVINSTSATETSTVNWLIINP